MIQPIPRQFRRGTSRIFSNYHLRLSRTEEYLRLRWQLIADHNERPKNRIQ